MPEPVVVSAAVEGELDEAVLLRLLREVGVTPGQVYGKRGKPHLRDRIRGYNEAAKRAPWVVLVDLNGEECAPALRDSWLPTPARLMRLRVAVRAVEAWLLADRDRLAQYLRIRAKHVPSTPEGLDDPKESLLELARRSSSRFIREDMLPRPGSQRRVGPAYLSRLIQFVHDDSDGWRPWVAAAASDSLSRCLNRLQEFSSPSL